jgi:nucleotide-binding universal stress UspA family protein
MDTGALPTSPFQKILFCTDFSENADYAFDFAIDAAVRRPGCSLYLLHVVPESDAQFWKTYIYEVDDVDQKAKNDIDDKIRRSYQPRVPAGLPFRVEVRVGKDYNAILEFAEEMNVDLIVIGRRGHSTLQKALFGNVTEKVARKAPCAVLIIPLDFQKKHLP